MKKAHEEGGGGLGRRRFLRTTGLIGVGLALNAASCGRGGKTSEGTKANSKAAEDPCGPGPPPTAQGSPDLSAPQSTQPYSVATAIVPASPASQLNVALLGCGVQGRFLVQTSQRERGLGVRVKAICDISPYCQAYTKNLFGRIYKQDVTNHVYEDYREMLACEKELDAVLIATPDWMHAEHAIACAKAGLHVYCETPISHDLGQARELVRTARAAGTLLQIGLHRRSNPRYCFACERLIRNGQLIGPLTSASACWNRSILAAHPQALAVKAQPPLATLQKYGYASIDEFVNWRWYRKYSGGYFSQLGAHQIDVLSWFLDTRPARVTVNGGRDYWGKPESEVTCEWYDTVNAIYEFPTRDGMVRAHYQMRLTTSFMRYFESFTGTQGMLSISEDGRRCWVYSEPTYQCGEPYYGGGTWDEYVKKGDLVQWRGETMPCDQIDQATGVSDICRLYREPEPPPYCFGVKAPETIHGPHLRNFFNAIRRKEKLNCPGEVAYATTLQVLKVNQLLDAGQDSGKFEAADFNV
jgi:predicted dehydrogenase